MCFALTSSTATGAIILVAMGIDRVCRRCTCRE
jgi:hypothetical protein